ncbi:MAG: (E)-4-hydroxy-3-methylbut-2-enyl-diphosphate synthase [Bacteroidales bacterium]|jgi:(E)-4-hydroxy-3-methylbut-2-enyl-diphosphate synthase|nr:(E)-4-hydroxy-3-methylbut-2-enyl-diphosphate synthase [Bacteroidales bacterium]
MLKLNTYSRRQSSVMTIGTLSLGGNHPVSVQSMTTTDTMDTNATVEQFMRIIDAGGEYVRVTAQGVREAENVKFIKAELLKRGYTQPIIVDIHFNPKAAYEAAKHADKVRINPGNFADTKTGDNKDYTSGIDRIRDKFIPFLDLCKKHHTAIRIGVNHGSLSERMMNKYGDTPEGMVVACMEYLNIAHEEKFDNLAISIKASNTRVMVHTVRLLVKTMDDADMHYPLHLGVTEAGDAEDGRIKSAVGTGALLNDGIGDTIRVSLSEAPEKEIPVAIDLVKIANQRANARPLPVGGEAFYSPFSYKKRPSYAIGNIGGDNKAVVWTSIPEGLKTISLDSDKIIGVNDVKALSQKNMVIIAKTNHPNVMAAHRSLMLRLMALRINAPVIFAFKSDSTDPEFYQLLAASELGGLLLDGFGDGVLLEGPLERSFLEKTAYTILQASRVLFTKTEYISCPGCGRTLFGLEEVIAQIKAKTSHLKGLKIGIMGCIVNGPGEMADADYGYVGAGKGKISLYKGQECMKKGIPQEKALDELISLIKDNGDWEEVSRQ